MIKKISTYEKISKIKEVNFEMGKNKLPANLKQLKGTYRKSRELVNEHLTSGVPEKPSNLTPGAVRYWHMLIDRLIKIGTVDIADDFALAILAESLNEYEAMTHFLNKNGRVYSFTNNKNETCIRPRPEIRIQNDCWTRIFQLFKEFGLTFKSRINITPIPLIQKENVWTNLRRSNEK